VRRPALALLVLGVALWWLALAAVLIARGF
jgi:hypothetical protein